MSIQKIISVAVHKANIKLNSGETIDSFIQKLYEAGKKYVYNKFKIKEDSSSWLVESFGDYVVFALSKMNEPMKYFAFTYNRNEKGDFDFGKLVEVKRVINYEPVNDIEVIKEEEKEEIEKAKKALWSAAFINDLPDAAFAVIETGGKKDSGGKTTPRALRHLPHHNSEVKNPNDNKTVDLPHLRNALARISQTNISDELKKKAMNHLEKHSKELLKKDVKKNVFVVGNWQEIEKSIWSNII